MKKLKKWSDVEGWLTSDEARYLTQLVLGAPPGPAVEVGAYKGRASIVISGARPVTCVDDFFTGGEDVNGKPMESRDFLGEWINNTEGYPCKYHRDKSVKASESFKNNSIAFLYLDASHDRESVEADIAAWEPKLMDNGIIAFHDVAPGFPGVVDAVTAFSQSTPCPTPEPEIGSIKAYVIDRRPESERPAFKLAVAMPISWSAISTKTFLSYMLMFRPQRFNELMAVGAKEVIPMFGMRNPLDVNRNTMVQGAIDRGCEVMVFLDGDMTWPPYLPTELLKCLQRVPGSVMASGIYHKKAVPHQPVNGVWSKGKKSGYPWHDALECMPEWNGQGEKPIPPRYVKTDVVGMGCCAFRLDAVKKMDKPWFYYDHDYPGNDGKSTTEELPFCRDIAKHGSIITDTFLECGHLIEYAVDSEPWEQRYRSDFLKQKQERPDGASAA